MRRREAHTLNAFNATNSTQQVRESTALTEPHTVGIDVLTQQSHLDSTLRRNSLNLSQNVAGTSVALFATQMRHDTERARVITAHRNRHPRRKRTLPVGRQGRGKHFQRFLNLDGSLAVMRGARQQCGKHINVMRAKNSIDPRRLGDDTIAHLLRKAAPDGDLHAGTLTLDSSQLTEVTEQASRRIFTHGAGVDDDDVGSHIASVSRTRGGFGNGVNGDEASLLEQTRHTFGVVFIHLAAERSHRVSARSHTSLRHRRIHRTKV